MFTSYAEAGVMGRVTKAPIFESQSNGSFWIRFSLAVKQDYKDRSGQTVKKSLFVNCVAYGKTAEFLHKFVKEKDRLFVKGDLRSNNYEAKDGHKVKDIQLVVTKFQLIDYQKEKTPTEFENALGQVDNMFNDQPKGVYQSKPVTRPATPTFTVDDIPF